LRSGRVLETPDRHLPQRTPAEARHDRHDSYHKKTERHSAWGRCFSPTPKRRILCLPLIIPVCSLAVMIDTLSDAHLADYAAIEPMYVDGVAGVFNLGANFGTMFFRWTPVRSEDGPVMFERSPAFVLVQPRSALLCGRR
jgi:hypothetical protein